MQRAEEVSWKSDVSFSGAIIAESQMASVSIVLVDIDPAQISKVGSSAGAVTSGWLCVHRLPLANLARHAPSVAEGGY